SACMRAVVMAGGEGTRLRPLTSNQPKPMVPIVGKPCMEHILELLREHGMTDVVITVAFLPQAIRSYFGDGSALGLNVEYSVEDPLEFGIVVTDDDGRVERFLEKPSWGQVFSDTINTGIYVLEPEVLRHVPTDRPYDFSKELFPLLLEMGRPIYGYVCDGYWQDIGNLDQYRKANFDALDEKVRLDVPGVRLRGNIWLGEGVEIDVDGVEGPAFIGNYCRIAPDARIEAYSVLGASVTLRERARTARSVIDTGTYIGRNSSVEGAI